MQKKERNKGFHLLAMVGALIARRAGFLPYLRSTRRESARRKLSCSPPPPPVLRLTIAVSKLECLRPDPGACRSRRSKYQLCTRPLKPRPFPNTHSWHRRSGPPSSIRTSETKRQSSPWVSGPGFYCIFFAGLPMTDMQTKIGRVKPSAEARLTERKKTKPNPNRMNGSLGSLGCMKTFWESNDFLQVCS